MSKKVDPTPARPIAVQDVLTAPFIYFDAVSTFSNADGVVRLALVAERLTLTSANDQPVRELVTVGQLRCSVFAAVNLRDALNAALLAGVPVEGKAN